MKKILSISSLLVMMCASVMAASKKDLNLIVAPARYSVMQVMFDVLEHRPSVLVSYQDGEKGGEPLLHVWNGAAWTRISLHDLRELSFVQKTPKRAIMVGDDDLIPAEVKDALSWMPEVVILRQLDNASLLNDLGRVLDWKRSEWAWFSARYNLTLEDEAAALRNSSWYDQPGPLAKPNEPVYKPVPYIKEGENLNPSSNSLPAVEPVEPPSDLEAPASTSTAPDEAAYDDDIQEIVNTLERTSPDASN